MYEMKTLKDQTCKTLRTIAKELCIVGRWDMTKDELIDAICKISSERINAARARSLEVEANRKMKYVENVAIGTLVAFQLNKTGKVRSAKVVKKSTVDRKLMVQTAYGASYAISFDDVIWVRTGKRWPKGVYLLLKGQVAENAINA